MSETKDFPSYLEGRKPVIEQREAFLLAAKHYLAREQRPDAGDLNELRWNHPARQIRGSDWLINPTRGYLVLREDKRYRPFRLVIEQPGNSLVVELSVLEEPSSVKAQKQMRYVADRLTLDGLGQPHIFTEREDEAVRAHCRWQISVPHLYTSVRAIENAHYQIWRVFDSAVIHLIPA